MAQRTLELFKTADNLISFENDDAKIKELSAEILEQLNHSYNNLIYDDFMRMLVAIERITDHINVNKTLSNPFALEFFRLEVTQSLLIPQHELTRARYSSALLATASHLVQKLDSSFYQSLEQGSLKNNLVSGVVSGLMLPNFFETMREDEIYNKQSFTESCAKAKVFVPQAEKLWKVLTIVLGSAESFPKEVLPEAFLLVGEYTSQYPCSWSSQSILNSVAEIKRIFSNPPSTPSKVLGEYILKIISIALKKKTMITSLGAVKEYPDLSLHPMLIQFCLSTIENSDYKMKETGFSTLAHIVQNVNAVELAQFQNEIYAVLAAFFTSQEAPLLTHVLPLAVQLLQKCKKVNPLPQSTLDSLFSAFLLGINNNIPELSAIYIHAFPQLFDLAGIHVVTYAAVLFPYLEGALDLTNVAALDRASLQALLHMLKSLVANCWPRVPVYKFQILKASMSAVVGKDGKCEDIVIVLVSDVLGMLRSCCGDDFKELESLMDEVKTMYPIANKITLT